MADPGEASCSSPPSFSNPVREFSSIPVKEKPVFVRVKRKPSQSRVDAFWLEINERPLKRRLLDMDKLSISDDAEKVQKDSRTKKLLVQHVETISQSEATKNVLHSFLPDHNGAKDFKRKIEDQRSMQNQDKKQDQLQSVAKQVHEDFVRNARFEQIGKRRKGNKEADEFFLSELCHLYDVIRVDSEDEKSGKVQESKSRESLLEDNAILCNYLPLLREFLPAAAEEIESELHASLSKEENYVYDLYTVEDLPNSDQEVNLTEYPLVQVNDDEDDYHDGSLQSEYDTDDSNAEDNPRNDYPEEDSIKDDESIDEDPFNNLEGSDSEYEEEVIDLDEEDPEDWKWGYR